MHSTLRFTILTALAVLMVNACTSPLDSDTPRKVTPVTPAMKITPSSVNTDFTGASGLFTVKGLPLIKVDTTVTPMRFWLDITMKAIVDTGKGPMLHEFRIQLDSFPADGLIANLANGEASLLADFGSGEQVYPSEANTNVASIIVAEHPRTPGAPREVTITFYVILNKDGFFSGVKQEQTLGTMRLVF